MILNDALEIVHSNAFSGCFLVLEVTHGLDQGTHHFSSWNFCVCQVFQYQHHSFAAHRFQGRAWWISLRRFRSDSSYSMYALYDSSFPRRVEQDGFPQNRFVWRCLSQQQLPRRHNTICVQWLLSIGTFIEYFLNCDFVRSSWSYTCCLMVSSVFPSTLFSRMRHKDQCLGGCFFSKSVYSLWFHQSHCPIHVQLMLSTKGDPSRIRMTKFQMQVRNCGLGCVSFLFSCQVQS